MVKYSYKVLQGIHYDIMKKVIYKDITSQPQAQTYCLLLVNKRQYLQPFPCKQYSHNHGKLLLRWSGHMSLSSLVQHNTSPRKHCGQESS